MSTAEYCRPQGSALSAPIKTCRPGSAPKGCFFYVPYYNSIALTALENQDFATVQPAIAVDMVGEDSHADIDLVRIEFPFIQGADNWLPKVNAGSSANTGFSDTQGIRLNAFTSDIRTENPWPKGLPIVDSDNFLRMGAYNANAGAQVAEGWVTFWVPPNAGNKMDSYAV